MQNIASRIVCSRENEKDRFLASPSKLNVSVIGRTYYFMPLLAIRDVSGFGFGGVTSRFVSQLYITDEYNTWKNNVRSTGRKD